jgi:hypothetical protein
LLSALGAPSAQSWRLLLELLEHRAKQAADEATAVFSGASIDGASDVAIAHATERQLAAFPWELAFQPSERRVVYRTSEAGRRETIVWVQRALRAQGRLHTVDGVLGPETEHAIRETLPRDAWTNARQLKKRLREAAPDGRPRRVLVLRSPMEEERLLRRGHGRVGMDVAKIYKSCGADVMVVEYHRLDELQERLQTGPDLIHIVSGFLEPSSTREICLDLAQLRGQLVKAAPVPSLTASHFKVFLEQRPRNEPAPFFLLEAPLPDDTYERARQVMMRNAFASELMAFVRTSGVLATGLFADATLLGRYREFIELIAGNPTQRKLYGVASAQIAAEFPPALFTADPDLPILS